MFEVIVLEIFLLEIFLLEIFLLEIFLLEIFLLGVIVFRSWVINLSWPQRSGHLASSVAGSGRR
jgi:hypothetical protein